ncbi:MAG: LamG domain-containing protein [Planctomycetes bacterium]|nr:LamG domain-containing protein [Planctomycetota bacterium]
MSRVFSLFSPGIFGRSSRRRPLHSVPGGYQPDASTVLLFKMDEGLGGDLGDATLYNNDGQIQGAAWGAGRYGRGLHFDGVNDRVEVPDSPSLRLSSALTLEAWIRPGSDISGSGTILAKRESYELRVFKNPMPRAVGAIWIGGEREPITSQAKLEHEVWQHIALTFDGSRLALYVNGVLDKDRVLSPSLVDVNAEPLFLGVFWNGPGLRWYAGGMDEVRLSSIARAASELDPNG